MESPASSVYSAFSDMDDDELERYLATCKPLSSLPTPPPAKAHPTARYACPPTPPDDRRSTAASIVQEHAAHLAGLVPCNVAPHGSDEVVIAGILERADLPLDVVALAACVLQRLSAAFAGAWQRACAQSRLAEYYLGVSAWQHSHCPPELVVLAALALAHGFVDDRGWTNRHWAAMEYAGRFSAKDVETAKRCILADTDYRLFGVDATVLEQMQRAMQPASDAHESFHYHARSGSIATVIDGARPKLARSMAAAGIAQWVHGVQTPGPSP